VRLHEPDGHECRSPASTELPLQIEVVPALPQRSQPDRQASKRTIPDAAINGRSSPIEVSALNNVDVAPGR
jgi:hypothetical protein